jgi:hypothetical protein
MWASLRSVPGYARRQRSTAIGVQISSSPPSNHHITGTMPALVLDWLSVNGRA